MILVGLLVLISCPEPPDTKPELADCPIGQSPCEDDTTTCCWDTTSHNFVWEIDTLGGSGSFLNDVAIVDENNIWVVGALSIDDSTLEYEGQLNYNAAHWDGQTWNYIQVCCAGLDIEGIFYFSENDIWLATGNIFHWDGVDWTNYHLWNMGVLGPNDGGVSQVWGTSSSNIYFIGENGSIVHYDGNSFTKLESGTEFNFKDMWGIVNNQTDQITIGFTGKSSIYEPNDSEVLLYTDNLFTQLPDSGLSTNINGIWFNDDKRIYVVGAGLFIYEADSLYWIYVHEYPEGAYLYDIIGPENDLFIVGAFGRVSHFNGNTWYHYNSADGAEYFYGRYVSISRKDNMIVACGLMSEGGVVTRGVSQ